MKSIRVGRTLVTIISVPDVYSFLSIFIYKLPFKRVDMHLFLSGSRDRLIVEPDSFAEFPSLLDSNVVTLVGLTSQLLKCIPKRKEFVLCCWHSSHYRP